MHSLEPTTPSNHKLGAIYQLIMQETNLNVKPGYEH
jgi:hypothetical protein